jgi:hypothetical protein
MSQTSNNNNNMVVDDDNIPGLPAQAAEPVPPTPTKKGRPPGVKKPKRGGNKRQYDQPTDAGTVTAVDTMPAPDAVQQPHATPTPTADATPTPEPIPTPKKRGRPTGSATQAKAPPSSQASVVEAASPEQSRR